MSHTVTDKKRLQARVRRIEGQVQALGKALQSEAECMSVLQQIASIRGAVNGLMDEILEAHLREHVAAPNLDEAARQQGADEVIAAIRRYAK